MEPLVEALFQEAMSLSSEQRIDLARRLVESVKLHSKQSQAEIEAALEAEFVRRIESFEGGESKPVPASEVFANLMEVASDQEQNGTYSAEWQAAFGSIEDPTFEVPPRVLPRPLETLDSE